MPFLVLPDHPAGPAIVRQLSDAANLTVLPHASGRPWVVGRWPADTAVRASVGRNSVVVLGRTTVDTTALTARLRDVRGVADLDSLATGLAGTFHLIASIDGEVRFQGSLSTARHVYHTLVDGVAVAADEPQSLAALSGAGVDEEVVVLRLMSLWPPAPLADRCAWRGVRSPAAGFHLVLRPDGTVHNRRWWTVPEPEVPLSEAASVVRDALVAGVLARQSGDGGLSADLSGGMDSTSLCFVAARHGVPHFTFRFQPLDPANDDDRWAGECEARLPDNEHIVVAHDDGPDWYAESPAAAACREGPMPFYRNRAMLEYVAKLVAARGSTTHMQGLNGDELFRASAMCLHALARAQPLAALGRVRATRAMRRWTIAGTARFLLSNPSYGEWLATCADRLTVPWPKGVAEFEWEIAPKMPPWASRDAVELARDLLRTTAAGHPRPMSPLAVQHAMVRITRVNGEATRHMSVIGAAHGVSFESPYLDDRVLTAALSVRLADRITTGRYKPVLAAAMRGIAPDNFLNRQTKGDFSAELYRGLNRQRPRLLELCEDSRLARMGLINAEALRELLFGLHTDSRPLMPLEATLGCESWLRLVDDQSGKPSGAHERSLTR